MSISTNKLKQHIAGRRKQLKEVVSHEVKVLKPTKGSNRILILDSTQQPETPKLTRVQAKFAKGLTDSSQKEYVSLEQFKAMYPEDNIGDIKRAHGVFNANAERLGLTSKKSQQIFFAQIKYETGGKVFRQDENLNYSVSALKRTFKAFADNPELAAKYGRNEEIGQPANKVMIGNIAYGNRLGNTEPDDGYKYRGWGNIQVTGKANYIEAAKTMGISLDEMMRNKDDGGYQMLASMSWYDKHKANKSETVDDATKIINRHTDSYEDRRSIWNSLDSIFSS